jgi:hypothetical protein
MKPMTCATSTTWRPVGWNALDACGACEALATEELVEVACDGAWVADRVAVEAPADAPPPVHAARIGTALAATQSSQTRLRRFTSEYRSRRGRSDRITSPGQPRRHALACAMNNTHDYAAGWGTLSLINAGLAQTKGRSGLAWWAISLLLGPLATLLIVMLPFHDAGAVSRR